MREDIKQALQQMAEIAEKVAEPYQEQGIKIEFHLAQEYSYAIVKDEMHVQPTEVVDLK